MYIKRAVYHNKDVTDLVRSMVKNDHLFLQASNSIFGDPSVGTLKNLVIDIEIDGIESQHTVVENDFIKLPPSTHSRLGIFYSDNNDDRIQSCISASLNSILRASFSKADIITCVWKPIHNNPFTQILAPFQSRCHLNQVIQILQCLYTANNTGTYKYVSFLEHDVLYPEGYFDYEDFDCDCICNTNYIGMNKHGFQAKTTNHQPLSQLTMNMDFAIKHFESILPNAIFLNSGIVEPKSKIPSWSCQNPSVHVNHGRHFTSHYSIYSQKTVSNNDYWGDVSLYSNLFF